MDLIISIGGILLAAMLFSFIVVEIGDAYVAKKNSEEGRANV